MIQSVIENLGIPTVSISLLSDVTKRVAPPRALIVNRPFGYPLGAPADPALQTGIVKAALAMLATPVASPLIVEYPG